MQSGAELRRTPRLTTEQKKTPAEALRSGPQRVLRDRKRASPTSITAHTTRGQGGGGAKSFDDIAALLRVCHEFINRHLALGLVVNVPGTPKSLHLPIAALDSCRIVSHQSMEIATCRAQRHILIDFPQQHVFHICVTS